MAEQRIKSAFVDVDKSNMSQRRVQYLDFQHTFAFTQMYKQRTRTLLDIQPGHLVLDAGCGTGQDACETARLVGSSGHVTGFDFSQIMLDLLKDISTAVMQTKHFSTCLIPGRRSQSWCVC